MEEAKGGSGPVSKGEEKGQAPGGAAPDKTDQGSPAEGTKFVEFKTPEEEARFKRIYGHVKKNERIIGQMAGDNKVLFDANQKLTERLAAIEKHISEKGTADSLAWLQNERRAAIEAGDLTRVSDLSDKIAEVKVRTEVGKLAKPKQAPPVQMAAQREQDFLGTDLREAFTGWANEKDKSGNLARPWAQTGHPKFRRAVEMAAAVLNDPEFQGEDSSVVLREVDRLMGNSKPAASTVLSGKDAEDVKPKGPKLTADQLAVAKKMGVSPEKYAQQMERYRRA